MPADADFMVYVAARWHRLVKEAVLLGVRPEEAAEVTTEALARCRRGWAEASRDSDVDALVREQLTAAARRRARTDESDRERAAQELLVLAPPTLQELKQHESRRNRALLRRVTLVAVPLLLVAVGGGAYLASGDDHPAPRPHRDVLEDAGVEREENPAPGVIWYADGRLHLDHTVLEIEGLRDMTRIGVGVVYDDEDGRVVYASDDGALDVLGRHSPDAPSAATDENGWVAWVESGPDEARLVVNEASTGNEVARAAVPDESRVIAVDGDTIYFETAEGAFALQPGGPPAIHPVTPAALLDVRSRIRAFQIDPSTIKVVQSAFDAEFDLPGMGAALAPDGDSVATRLPGTEDSIAVYDARSGEALPTGLSRTDHVVAFAPGARLTISYIVASEDPSAGAQLELRTCTLLTTVCTVAARIPHPGDTPVLAR